MGISSPSQKETDLKQGAKDWLADLGYFPLTRDETNFLKQVTLGNKIEPMQGRTSKPQDKTIRAALIRWLCSDKDAQALVWPEGIGIEYVTIEGEKISFFQNNVLGLNLSSLKIPFPIILHHCVLPDWLLLLGTDIPFLDLDGCKVDSIKADVLKVRGDLYMRCVDHKEKGGVIKLLGATIGGDLDLGGARLKYGGAGLDDRFLGEKHLVLNAEGIKVEGDVHFTAWEKKEGGANKDKFLAEGGISLDEAQIGSDIKCDGASLTFWENKKVNGDALTLRGATIKGHIYFSDGFRSVGPVRLPGAEIGQSVDCTDGHFCNPWRQGNKSSGVALELDGADIKLDLKLSGQSKARGASACGTVSLVGAKIGRVFDCRFGRFRQSDVPIGHVEHRWRPALDLTSAHVGVLSYPFGFSKVELPKGQLALDGFVYDRVDGAIDRKICLEWIKLQYPQKNPDETNFKSQPYLQLAKLLRETGKSRDARHVLSTYNGAAPAPRAVQALGMGTMPGYRLWLPPGSSARIDDPAHTNWIPYLLAGGYPRFNDAH